MNDRIWLSSPHMSGWEEIFVKEAFDTNWIAPLGPHVDGFEADLAAHMGEGYHVAALSSGTAALHLALILLDVKQGDEVICQSMTFSASANPIVYQGATPVFVDSEDTTWNMSPQYLEEAIRDRIMKGKKPKAIIVVHLYGMPAKMDEIMEIAGRYEIPVVEDAAEALGSCYKDKPLGSFGDFSILSFNGNKIITTSGGGALVSKDGAAISRARYLATQARDPAPWYQHSVIGYNYRLSNVCAGIGRGQMKVLGERVRQRRANFQYYLQALKDIPEISFLAEPDKHSFSNRWLTTALIHGNFVSSEQVSLSLNRINIESRPLWKPMHLQPVFTTSPFYGPGISETLFKSGICLPSGSNLSLEQLDRVTGTIRASFLHQTV